MSMVSEAGSFVPSALQFELMEHAVGGDSRHRNYYTISGDDDDWDALVAAGLAIEDSAEDDRLSIFHVSPAGLALLDARSRPRILEGKAAAWDTFRATFWEVFERDDGDDGTLAEAAKTFITNWERANRGGAPAIKGPRAIAEQVVNALTADDLQMMSDLGKRALEGDDVRPSFVERLAEIIRKAIGGAS